MGDMIAASMVEMVTSLKVIYDLSKTAIEARDAGIAREKMIELQREIFATQENALSAQSDQFELLKRVDALEAELAYLKEWDAKREKYRLTKLSNFTDALGYTLEEKVDSSEPDHALCPNCFTNRVESILQKEKRAAVSEVMFCHRCGLELYIQGMPPASAPKKAMLKIG